MGVEETTHEGENHGESIVGEKLSVEQLESVRSALEKGLGKHLGFHYIEMGPDRAAITIDVEPYLFQPFGIVHGGVYAAVVEELGSVAGNWWLKGAGRCVGVNNSTDFFRPTTSGILTATATPVFRGKTQQLWMTEITNAEGKLVARGQVRLANIYD